MTVSVIPDLLEVSRWLAAEIAGEVRGIQEVRLGIHEAIGETPACEVVAIGGPLQLPTDGSGPSLDWWSWQLVLYDALGKMADRDETETELLPIACEIYNLLRDEGIDTTAGGLVSRLKPGRLELDVTIRNGRPYRTAAAEVLAGVLPPLHR